MQPIIPADIIIPGCTSSEMRSKDMLRKLSVLSVTLTVLLASGAPAADKQLTCRAENATQHPNGIAVYPTYYTDTHEQASWCQDPFCPAKCPFPTNRLKHPKKYVPYGRAASKGNKESYAECVARVKRDYPVPPGNINEQNQMIKEECGSKQ